MPGMMPGNGASTTSTFCSGYGSFCSCCGTVYMGRSYFSNKPGGTGRQVSTLAELFLVGRVHSLRVQSGVLCNATHFGHNPNPLWPQACWCESPSAPSRVPSEYNYSQMVTDVLQGEVYNRSLSRLVASVLQTEVLQQAYSVALYAGPDRVDVDTLMVVLLDLLPNRTLRRIEEAGGICRTHAKQEMPPFYGPHHMHTDPRDTMWIRRNLYGSRNRPVANHSWIEVTHCGAYVGDGQHAALFSVPANRSKIIGMIGPRLSMGSGGGWLYVARGSGVSLNVGRTTHMGFADLLKTYRALFNHTRTYCDERGQPHWLVRDRVRERNPPGEAGSLRPEDEWRDVGSEPPTSFASWFPFDSVQVTGHHEFFSAERRHEIFLPRLAECASLEQWALSTQMDGEDGTEYGGVSGVSSARTTSRGGLQLRCGRSPWLRRCDIRRDPGFRMMHPCRSIPRSAGAHDLYSKRVRAHVQHWRQGACLPDRSAAIKAYWELNTDRELRQVGELCPSGTADSGLSRDNLTG